MKILIGSSYVPFIEGGGTLIVTSLQKELQRRGHVVEVLRLPMYEEPGRILSQLVGYRMIDVSAYDLYIAIRPPAHVIDHPHKRVWFIHHFRQFFDMWGTRFYPHTLNPSESLKAIRHQIQHADTTTLHEAERVYTNSAVMRDRVVKFNGLSPEVLYPPLPRPGRFKATSYGDNIVYVSRVEPGKRQDLAIMAMRYTKTPVRLEIYGASMSPGYGVYLRFLIATYGLQGRVTLHNEWISELRKARVLSECLGTLYVPYDEDSYGYSSLEASHSCKAILTVDDAGGALELVENGHNGFVTEPEPEALAEAMDQLYLNRALARRMGIAAEARLVQLDITWDRVVTAFTS